MGSPEVFFFFLLLDLKFPDSLEMAKMTNHWNLTDHQNSSEPVRTLHDIFAGAASSLLLRAIGKEHEARRISRRGVWERGSLPGMFSLYIVGGMSIQDTSLFFFYVRGIYFMLRTVYPCTGQDYEFSCYIR